MSRTSNSIRNTKYAIIGQMVGMIVTFLNRMVFVRILNAEYLGLNGLFTNILSILSFAELGIGAAIVFSLYKPLAEKNQPKIKALMQIYKKAYIFIGILIAILGLSFLPFLGIVIKDTPNIPNIQVIYLMFVFNSVISYFYSYKRSMLIADQKGYIDSFYRYSFNIGMNILQIIFLLLTHNYIFYLAIKIVSTIIENIAITRHVNKLYPYLNEKSIEKLNVNDKKTLLQNIKAMIFHKVGSVVVMSTDNLLIAKFVSLVTVGIYSNYLLIINALNTIFGLAFQSITASVGNLGATETKEKSKFIFHCVDLIGFWIYAFASISLLNLINPFINLWIGEEYLFSMPIVIVLVINFYLTGMRKSVQTFKEAFGLFWQDRYKPLFEAGVNLVISIILAKYLGTIGVFIGTAISTITTCFWIEPYVLYKYGFNLSSKKYFLGYFFKTVAMFTVGIITWYVCSLFPSTNITGFIAKILICAIVPNILFVIIFFRTKEFQYLFKILKNRVAIIRTNK